MKQREEYPSATYVWAGFALILAIALTWCWCHSDKEDKVPPGYKMELVKIPHTYVVYLRADEPPLMLSTLQIMGASTNGSGDWTYEAVPITSVKDAK